ncbi:MAG: hypothetical protein ACQESH_02025 [Campylobacterota bacterium]
MRIETLKSLIGGRLLNAPAITSIENIVFEAKKVKRGDLFLANDSSQIEQAVQNGAYAIIVDTLIAPNDSEIAWIKVASLSDATIKLLRFYLEYKPKKIIYVSPYHFQILKAIDISHTSSYLDAKHQSLHQLFNDEKSIFLSDNKIFLQSFAKEYDTLEYKHDQNYTITSSTLFESSFIYKENFYKNIAIAPFFVDKLTQSIEIAHKLKLDTKVEKLTFTEFFTPVFFNAQLKEVEFGKGSKVIIFSSCKELVQQYCKQHLQHLRILYYAGDDVQYLYSELKNRYDYAVVSNLKKAVLQLPPFYKEEVPATLF